MTILEEMKQMRDETQYSVYKDIYARAVEEMEQLQNYIKNWKDTDSAAIMALKQAQEEIERLRAENAVLLKGFENQQSKAKAALMKLEKGLNLL